MIKTPFVLLACFLFVAGCAHLPQMENQPAQLKREITQDLVENILPFWVKHAPDPSGGFYGVLNVDGTPGADAVKGGLLNARLLWTFSAAYRMLQDEQYRALADRAQRYFLDHFIDPEHGGAYFAVTASGEPLWTGKTSYLNSFAIYGLSEHYRATGNTESLDAAIAVYRKLMERAYDPLNGGFITSFSREWEVDNNYPKIMNANLHVLEALTNLYRVWDDDGLRKILRGQAEVMSQKVLDQTTWHQRLFFTMDWQSRLETEIESYGHDIEFSWLLVEAAEVLGDEALLHDARRIAVSVAATQLKKGIDANGAMYYEKSGDHLNDNLEWWPQAEAVVGFLNAWQISGDKKFLDAAVRTWEWIKANMIDYEHGEWHRSATPDKMPQKTNAKADLWRCPYHNSRMGFEVMTRLP